LSVKKGDFILVDYVTKIKETEEIFDTTIVEEAKKGGVYKENSIYEPMFIVVGENWVLKKLDESLVDVNLDVKTTIEIPPEDGFGLRDADKIRIISINKIRKQNQNIRISPGSQVEVDGKTAIVRSIGAGRVQVDFNSPLAGKTLVYDLAVKKIFEDKLDKIKAIIHRRIPAVNLDNFVLTVTEKKITIELPEEAFYLEQIQLAKRGIASDLQKFFSPERIIFTEVFSKPHDPVVEEQTQPDEG